jgi:hypothetical protein
MVADYELLQGLRIARIIQTAEENKLSWEAAESLIKQQEREEFFNESVLDEV